MAITHDAYKLKVHFCEKLSFIVLSRNPLIQNFIPIAFEYM